MSANIRQKSEINKFNSIFREIFTTFLNINNYLEVFGTQKRRNYQLNHFFLFGLFIKLCVNLRKSVYNKIIIRIFANGFRGEILNR